ncbi:MAG: hypothetical protein AAF629_20300 [Chloroflexota bacterium]
MVDLWFSPIAPVLIYLLGSGVIFLLARPHRDGYMVQSQHSVWIGLGVCLLVLVVLISRTGVGDMSQQQQLARWTVSNEGFLALDQYSLAYALMPTLFLIGFFWSGRSYQPVGLLVLAGTATTVFISSDRLAISYTLFIFDLVAGLYWFYRGRSRLVTLHFVLSVATLQALVFLDTTQPENLVGQILAILLWCRVSLWPMAALAGLDKHLAPSRMMMVWLVLNTSVSVYVAGSLFAIAWWPLLVGLITAFMLMMGWLAWLENQILLKYLYLIIIQANLAFLVAPTQAEASIALTLLYTLSLGVLWLTPQLGRPNVLERHWLWIYAAPIMMSVSLLGFPFTLGWFASHQIYQELLSTLSILPLSLIILAQALSLSVLPSYWVWLLHRSEKQGIALRATLILVVPFLVPWLGGLTISTITGLDLSSNVDTALNPQPSWALILIVWLIALGTGFGRSKILKQLRMIPQRLVPLIDLGWFWQPAIRGIEMSDQTFIRFRALFEGQSYFGWGLLLGLIGFLVLALNP